MEKKHPKIALVKKEYGEKEAKIMLSYLYTYFEVIFPYRGKIPEEIFDSLMHEHLRNLCNEMGRDNMANIFHFTFFYFNDNELIEEMRDCGDEFLLPEILESNEFTRNWIEENLKKFMIN